MIPQPLPFVDEQIRPAPGSSVDAWSMTFELDPTIDWTSETFALQSTAPDAYPMALNQSGKTDPTTPSLELSLSSDALQNITANVVHFLLSGSDVLAFTFLEGDLRLIGRSG